METANYAGTRENGPPRVMESTPVTPKSRKAKAQQSKRPAATRLTEQDWIDGALALLQRDGVGAIRIPQLCAELGVTKGSFYWHFSDVDQLLEAIADHWCGIQNDAVRGLTAVESLPVGERLEVMAEGLINEPTWLVESTIREWARTDQKVADAVRDLDLRIFGVLQKAMLELGFSPTEARTRAGTLVFAGIGFVHSRRSMPTPTSAELREMFDLLTRR
ncbi:TetR/AcrR family transcriptional regulator [Antrihabitans stalactiti]|nr:TetR/AcrR family transcriptional regulator [Antrihabitans stalactiti]